MDYKKMNLDDIINWCVENNQVAWLKTIAKSKPSFLVLRKAFCEKFMPELLPTKKEKPLSMWEKIANL